MSREPPYRRSALPRARAPSRGDRALHTEWVVLVVCATIVGVGIWRARYGVFEALALLGVVLALREMVTAWRARPGS